MSLKPPTLIGLERGHAVSSAVPEKSKLEATSTEHPESADSSAASITSKACRACSALTTGFRYLAELGTWLSVNGEGIYGTRAGTLTLSDPAFDPPAIEGAVATVNPDTGVHYVHLLDGRAPTVIYADLAVGEHADSARAILLHDGKEVDVEVRGDGDTLVLSVPSERRGGLATTVRIELG
jgi:hypothetical protein